MAASAAAETLLGRVGGSRDGEDPGQVTGQLAAAVTGQTSRYLAWLANTSLILSARQVTSAGAARGLVALAVPRQRILRQVDPDPPHASGPADLGTVLSVSACVLAWIADFTELHGSYQAAGLYPVYEILTGTQFFGNYWDGDSVLTGLRDALFAPGAAVGPAVESARRAFGTVGEFDRVWTLISVGAVAMLRDVRVAHPPELIRPRSWPCAQPARRSVGTCLKAACCMPAASRARCAWSPATGPVSRV